MHGSIKVKGMFTNTVLGTFRCPVAEMPRGRRKQINFALHDSSENVSGHISLYLRLQASAGVHVDNWVELGLGTRDLSQVAVPPPSAAPMGRIARQSIMVKRR